MEESTTNYIWQIVKTVKFNVSTENLSYLTPLIGRNANLQIEVRKDDSNVVTQ